MAKQQLVWRWVKRALLALGVIILIIVGDAYLRLFVIDSPPMKVASEKFITHPPFNLDQVIGISKFRSCQGHDHSGKNELGEIETNRSMKHYVVPRSDLTNELNTIEVFAPFDGTIGFIIPEAKGNQLIIYPSHDKYWGFLIFHVDLLKGIEKGSKLTSGQLIGYANVKDRHDFDIGLTRTNNSMIMEKILTVVQGNPHFSFPRGNYYVSPFHYMTGSTLSEFQSAGIDISDVEISKAERDQNPCNFDQSRIYDNDWIYKPGKAPQSPNQQLTQPPAQQANPAPPAELFPE